MFTSTMPSRLMAPVRRLVWREGSREGGREGGREEGRKGGREEV